MASRQRQRTERTRLAFLIAARTLLLEQGYTSTSVADIVQRGGRAHGTFYLYFDNKHDVFAALLSQLVTRALSDTERPMPAPSPDGPDPVRHAVEELARVVDAHHDLWRLIEEMSATDSTAIAARLQVREALETWFVAGWTGRPDHLEHPDPTLLAELVTGSLLWHARAGGRVATDELTASATDVLRLTLGRRGR